MPSDAEIELTFETGPGFALPDLTDVPGVAAVAVPEERLLEATYYDTADLRLAARRLTLRRRTGGHDAGWHLKRPRADGYRDELQQPLGDDTVPAEFTRLVRVRTRGLPLVPVVRISTRRLATVLVDAAGAQLLEIAQDDVTASVLGPDGGVEQESTWHELEAELVDGDLDLLHAVRGRLLAAGARISSSPSKLGRALGDRVPPPIRPQLESGSAAEALVDTLRQEVEGIVAQDPQVRADAHDAVHQMRVGCRRLRALLAAYRGVLDGAAVQPLRDELRWLGEELGAARDAEVVRDRLRDLVAAEPPELVLGPVERRIVESYSRRYRAAHDELLAALDGDRYGALLDALDELVARPPLGPVAGSSARSVYEEELRRTYRRARKLVRAARAAEEPHQREELMHEVRKSAKRARYAAEAASAVLGGRARGYGKAMKAVQEVLGEHQDSVVTRHELLELAAAAHLDGEDAFTYGRLHGLEQARAAATLQQFDGVWKAARRARP
jgi:CHAD domain-containing protein